MDRKPKVGIIPAGPHGTEMASAENRREHPRWKLEKDVFCYIDGVRLDARCENISTGGLFIRTSHQTALPVGTLVGLTFRMKKGSGNATFLFGRIVRRVAGRDGGVGLRWKKAVTIGPRAELAGFLKKIFRFEEPDIREEAIGKGQVRSVFHFPPQGMSKVMPIRTGPAEESPADDVEPSGSESGPAAPLAVPKALSPVSEEPPPRKTDRPHEGPPLPAREPPEIDRSEPIETHPPEETAPPSTLAERRFHHPTPTTHAVVNPKQGQETVVVRPPAEKANRVEKSAEARSSGFEPKEELPHSRQPGTISQMIARQDSLAQVNMRAEMVAHEVDVRAKIIRLGSEGMIVECPFILIDRKSVINVRFEISSKGSAIPIEAKCRLLDSVEGHETGTLVLELAIKGVDEGGHPGVLARYVKWLMFHSLAKA